MNTECPVRSRLGDVRLPSPLRGEGEDEGETPHLNPLSQGERKLSIMDSR